MCDTFVALPSFTASGAMILGKNSDREPNEAQGILRIPRLSHTEKTLRCTYIRIPQVETTYGMILSKPFQMWGAEMGVNEFGVAIGNEAVFTKAKFDKSNEGLTGMDLLRLALERSKTAKEALTCITNLLSAYGQDACGGYEDRSFFYHNAFIIADAQEAWVLETVGRLWAAEKVQNFRSISNGLTIGEKWDAASPNLVSFATAQGWTKKGEPFHFAKAYSAPFMTHMSGCKARQETTSKLGFGRPGRFGVEDAFAILSTHDHRPFSPDKASTASVCMHPTGLTNPSQTNGSMVVEVRPYFGTIVWLTGTSNPCLSLFKPVLLESNALLDFPQPSARMDTSLWWTAERLHRMAHIDYPAFVEKTDQERFNLQRSFVQAVEAALQTNSPLEAWEALTQRCFTQHLDFLAKWNRQWLSLYFKKTKEFHLPSLYRYYWKHQNRKTGLS